MSVKIEYYYKLNENKEKIYYTNNSGEIRLIGKTGSAFEMKKYLVAREKLSFSKANKMVESIKQYKEPKKEKAEVKNDL